MFRQRHTLIAIAAMSVSIATVQLHRGNNGKKKHITRSNRKTKGTNPEKEQNQNYQIRLSADGGYSQDSIRWFERLTYSKSAELIAKRTRQVNKEGDSP